VAWNTPIPEILLALDARTEWVALTSPFGGGKKAASAPAKPSADTVAAKLRAALTGRKRDV